MSGFRFRLVGPREALIAKLIKLAAVSHSAEPEDIQPEDSFQFPEHVAGAKELARQSLWGWCCVKTTAEYAGFKGVTHLGACSYESADNFVDHEGQTQTYEACAALLDVLLEAKRRGGRASQVLSTLRVIESREVK